jgi:hypothetical protein
LVRQVEKPQLSLVVLTSNIDFVQNQNASKIWGIECQPHSFNVAFGL